MLATTSGSIILLSTPFHKRGFFYEAWRSPAGWERIFKQEYMCEFVDNEYRIFSRELLEAALDPAIQPLPGFSEDDE
jgi:hypothetical protein